MWSTAAIGGAGWRSSRIKSSGSPVRREELPRRLQFLLQVTNHKLLGTGNWELETTSYISSRWDNHTQWNTPVTAAERRSITTHLSVQLARRRRFDSSRARTLKTLCVSIRPRYRPPRWSSPPRVRSLITLLPQHMTVGAGCAPLFTRELLASSWACCQQGPY